MIDSFHRFFLIQSLKKNICRSFSKVISTFNQPTSCIFPTLFCFIHSLLLIPEIIVHLSVQSETGNSLMHNKIRLQGLVRHLKSSTNSGTLGCSDLMALCDNACLEKSKLLTTGKTSRPVALRSYLTKLTLIFVICNSHLVVDQSPY